MISAPARQHAAFVGTEWTSFCFTTIHSPVVRAVFHTSLQPEYLLPPVGFSVKQQCLCSRCCWLAVQPDINNNKPLAWMFSLFGHTGAISISQKHCFWACLAPGVTTCGAVNIITVYLSCRLHSHYTPSDAFHRFWMSWDEGLVGKARRWQQSDWGCVYTVVPLMCLNSVTL